MMNHDSISNVYMSDFRPYIDYTSTRFMSTRFKEIRIATFRTRSPVLRSACAFPLRRIDALQTRGKSDYHRPKDT